METKVFKVAIITIRQWEIKLKEEGTLKKPVKRSFRKLDPEKLKAYFALHPDAYLCEAAEEFGFCETTITYACRKLKITRKRPRITRNSKEKRVYVDEAGFDTKIWQSPQRPKNP